MFIKIFVLLFLALCAYYDLKSLQLPLFLLVVFGVASGVLCLANDGFANGEFLLCLMPGMLFLLISFLTREALGYGDGVVLLLVCLLLEMKTIMLFIMLALALSALTALAVVTLMKKSRQTRLPFMPFLLVAWGVIIIWQ
jgi:leader peptidase (prepilin peptidase)/N-methyltransferase